MCLHFKNNSAHIPKHIRWGTACLVKHVQFRVNIKFSKYLLSVHCLRHQRLLTEVSDHILCLINSHKNSLMSLFHT